MAVTKNTADLLAQAAATLPDNTTQDISPQDEREMCENIAQSSYNKITDSALVGLKQHDVVPTYESGQGCINGGQVYISNKITGPGAFVVADWDLYANLSAADKAKLDFITVTGAADLDQMQTDIAALDGARINKGTFDQSLGVFPGGGTAQDGWTWIAVGATTTIDGVEINPDDAIVATVDNASTTVFAANWHLQDNTDKVLSVNSQSGAVVLTKTDIGLSNVPNTDFTAAVAANTAKVSNATHTSEVTGATALTINKIAISNKTLVTADGADHVLIGDASDSDNLKKVLVSDFLGGGSDTNLGTDNLTLSGAATRTYNIDGNELKFINSADNMLKITSTGVGAGNVGNPTAMLQVKGAGTTAGTTALLIENSAATSIMKFQNDGVFAHRGNAYNMLTENVTTFRARNSTANRGAFAFLKLNDSPLLTIHNEGVGINKVGSTAVALDVKAISNTVPISIVDNASNNCFYQYTDFVKGGTLSTFGYTNSTGERPTAAWFGIKASTTSGAALEIKSGPDPTTGLKANIIWVNSNKLKFHDGTGTVSLYQETGVSAMTNLTAPANLDADTVTTAELADIVGNLIGKLRAHGLVAD